MIKTFNVDNFKSLNNLSINLQPMTVIVGNNATGKSSILQAIDFVCGCVNDDFSVLLERRGWTVDNIRSKFIRSGTARISFGVEVVLEEPVNTTLKWGMVLQPNVAKNQLHLVSEEIVDLDTKETLVQYKVFLDYVKPEQIVLLYRDQNGSTRADNLFDSKEIRDKLEYMYPGAILLNMSQKEIIKRNILCAAHP